MPSQPPPATRPSAAPPPAPRGRRTRGAKVAVGADTGRCSILSTSQSLAEVWGRVQRFPKPPGRCPAPQRQPCHPPVGAAAQHPSPAERRQGKQTCSGRTGHPLRGHGLRRHASPLQSGELSPGTGQCRPEAQKRSRAGHGAPLLVTAPTPRAGNPSHLLNSKTVNTLRTGRLDYFPSGERTMLCSSS